MALNLRQKQMKSRLKEVENNFINSTTDADFARNSKLLQSLRTKANKIGIPTRTDKQLVEGINTNRKDKLKQGKIAGYQEGVYNPKTKKVEYASNVDNSNKYDIVSFADDLSNIGLGLTGAGLAYKLAKNPKLILELPKNVQKGVQAAYNKLKGNKTMAPKSPKKTVVDLTLSAVSKSLGSKLSKPSYDYLKGLPKVERDALLPKVNSGSLSTLKKIKDAAGKLDTGKLISDVSKNQSQATKALKNSKPISTKTDGRSDIQTRAKAHGRTSEAGRKGDIGGEPIIYSQRRGKGGKFLKAEKESSLGPKIGGAAIIAGTTALAVQESNAKKKDAETTSETVSDLQKRESQLGAKKNRKLTGEKKSKKDEIGTEDPSSAPTKKKTKKANTKSEDRRQKSQLNKPKGRAESVKDQILRQGKRKYGKITADSTDEGMSKFSGFDNQKELEAEEEMNFRKGGMPKRKAFGKGGMYKPSKKTYGMKKGGFTSRGASY